MARRSDHTHEELREMATSAGQKIISNEGFSKFSARKVAKEIGYTVGTIYNVFGTHDELILHINAATLDDLKIFLIKNLNKKLKPRSQVKQLAALYVEFAIAHQARWSALFEHTLPPESPLPDWYAQKIKALFLLLEEPLQSVVSSKKQTERAAKTIWACIHGICALGLTGKLDVVEADSVKALMEHFVDNYFIGVTYGSK